LPGLQPQQRAHRNAGGGGKVGEGEIALLAERARARPNSRSRFGQPTSTAAIWLTARDSSAPPRKLFELPHTVGMSATDTEPVVDLVWTSDSAHLVAITRLAGNPARSRVFLIDAAGAPETSDPSAGLELLLLPAEIVPASASPDPTGRWLAFLAHSTTTSSAA
jgi:hypothetical protein